MDFKLILKTSILIFCVIGLGSCNSKETEEPIMAPVNPCSPKLDMFAPNGFDIDLLGKIYLFGDVKSFQFVTDKVAFASAYINNETLQIFKSIDGGENWDLMFTIQDRVPQGLAFLNEDVGIITAKNSNGFCSDCGVVLKTEDGGLTWEEFVVEGTSVELESPVFDGSGNLFAIIGLGGTTGVFKSEDIGETWESIFDYRENDIGKYAHSLKIHLNKIYVASYSSSRILILDKNGELLNEIYSASRDLVDFQIIDENNMFVVGKDEVHRTLSGGLAWTTIYYGKTNFLGFTSATEGIFMLEKSNCSWRNSVNYVLVSTLDRGSTWNEVEEYTTLEEPIFWCSQKTVNGNLVLLFGNTFYQLNRQ